MISAKQLIECIEAGGHEARAYSGRGMFGKQCVGFTIEGHPIAVGAGLMLEAANISDDMANELLEAMESVASDALGLRTIVYFPSVAWTGTESEEE